MQPIPIEYLNSICEIKTMQNDLIATGTIREITEEYLEIADKFNMMQIVRYGTSVKVTVFNSKAGFRVLAGTVYTSSTEFVRLCEVVSLLEYERRYFFRVDTNISAYMMIAGHGSDGEADGTYYDENVMVKNMSLGGALFTSKCEFKPGDAVTLKIKLKSHECSFQCIVRRIEETELRQRLYGCEFLNVSNALADQLCSYIFQRQREQRRKAENYS